MFKPSLLSSRSRRGMTLVELMIVVAVIGVLATIASVSYSKYVQQAKITKLKQYAMDVSRGQEQYRARNNAFFPRTPGTKTLTSTTAAGSTDMKEWTQLLEFNHVLEAGVTVETQTGLGGACSICDGVEPETAQDGKDIIWFAVRVSQSMKAGTTGTPENVTAVIVHSDGLPPVVVREGQ